MKISPFTPICFRKVGAPTGSVGCYTHIFAPDDHIVIEVLHDSGEAIPDLYLAGNGERYTLTWRTCTLAENQSVSFYDLTGMNTGEYRFEIGDLSSDPIRITDNPEDLVGTVLIQYSMKTNVLRRDVYPYINGVPKYFEMRVEGGFKDADWNFGVECEQFKTPDSDIVEFSSIDSTDKILTIGSSGGVPEWMADKLLFVLLCNLIFIDGTRYSCPSEGSPIERAGGNADNTRFIYRIRLHEDRFLNAKFARIVNSIFRRVPDALRKTVGGLRKI